MVEFITEPRNVITTSEMREILRQFDNNKHYKEYIISFTLGFHVVIKRDD